MAQSRQRLTPGISCTFMSLASPEKNRVTVRSAIRSAQFSWLSLVGSVKSHRYVHVFRRGLCTDHPSTLRGVCTSYTSRTPKTTVATTVKAENGDDLPVRDNSFCRKSGADGVEGSQGRLAWLLFLHRHNVPKKQRGSV